MLLRLIYSDLSVSTAEAFGCRNGLCWLSLKWKERSPLVSIPPFGLGFSRYQAIPQRGCVPALPGSVSSGEIMVAPPHSSVSASGCTVTQKLGRRGDSQVAMELGFAHQIFSSSQNGSQSNRPCDGNLS